MADSLVKSILDLKHPAYEANLARWQRAERRLRAGEPATAELAPFGFETPDGEEHTRRKTRAVCLPLMHETARKFVDSVSRESPRPGEAHTDRGLSFGTLGTVRPALGGVVEGTDDGNAPAVTGTGLTAASRAEMVWTNADGTGDDGAPLETWLDGVHRRSMATGFRWVGVETPPRDPAKTYTAADDDGPLRPYAVEFSPTQTPYWRHDHGTLQVLHVVLSVRDPQLVDGRLVDKPETRHLLYVREGFDRFGERFKAGGWWLFTDDGDTLAEGTWEATGGAVPFTRFFYERDPQDPTGARAGLDEVGSIQTGLMDLESAARHDAHVRSSGLIIITNVTKEAHAKGAKQLVGGSNFVGIETNPESTGTPSIHDMASVSASTAVTEEIDRLFAWFKSIATKELTTAPDASGVAKQVEYEAEVSPRLAHMAKMREEALAFLLRMFELRWGGPGTTPTSFVRFPREYSLEPALSRVLKAAEVIQATGVSSPTISAKLADAALAEAGVVLSEAERTVVRDEIQQGATRAAQARAAADDLLG